MTNRITKKAQDKKLKARTKRKGKTMNLVAQQRAQRLENYRERINGLTPAYLDMRSVTDMLNQTINFSAGVGSTLEVLDQLVKEGKVVLVKETKDLIDEFDEHSVKFAETAEIITILSKDKIKADQIPSELLMDIAFRAESITRLGQDIFGCIDPYKSMVETYIGEHYQGFVYTDLKFKLAVERLTRLTPKYRTALPADAEQVEELAND